MSARTLEQATLEVVYVLLDRLDREDDQRTRCDLICDLQDLADDHPGPVAEAVKAGGVPLT